jgi:succinyl-CoA synthetase beta subunit
VNLHEFQAKIFLQKYGIPIPLFVVAANEHEVQQGIREIGCREAVVKAQVHAGGRGKAGGVKIGKNSEELLRLSKEMLGMRLVTKQTGEKGIEVKTIMISELVDIEKEYYMSFLIDRSLRRPIVMLSSEGGTEIEELAEKSPEKILRVPFCNNGKVRGYHLIEICKFMGWEGGLAKAGKELVKKCAQAFTDSDASLLEINPLVLTKSGELAVLDAKLAVDDDALFRQPNLKQWEDLDQLGEAEATAKEEGLSYIGLDGSIGCLVNGAGLAMATMDIIHLFGGEPANFLDVGGSATEEQIAKGFELILSDSRVKAIFVNIFGGIMDCGVLASGIVAAAKRDQVNVPLVVRMEGTNVERGLQILSESSLEIQTAKTMDEGAKKAVEAAGI